MNRNETQRTVLPLLVVGALGLVLAPGRAHAQAYTENQQTNANDIGSDSTTIPMLGVGAAGSMLVPIGLFNQIPPSTRAGETSPTPLGYVLGVNFRARFADRLMFHVGPGFGNLGWETGNIYMIPVDLGLRLDVIPIEGPMALWIGAVGRASLLFWSPQASPMTTDFGYSVTVAPEIALEFTEHRRYGFEIFARYNFGILNSAVGNPDSPFGANDQMAGIEIGVGSNLY